MIMISYFSLLVHISLCATSSAALLVGVSSVMNSSINIRQVVLAFNGHGKYMVICDRWTILVRRQTRSHTNEPNIT